MTDPRLPEGVDHETRYTAAQFAALPRTCRACGGRLTYNRVDVSDASSTTDYFQVGTYACSGTCGQES